MKKKRVIVSVTNDLVLDQRVNRTCTTLLEMGLDVLFVGRELPHSLPMPNVLYQYKRMRLFFNKGMLFYAEYNIRLFFLLLFSRYDIANSNDLDTLPANYFASLLRRKKIIFDSHEYFTGVPELVHNPFARKVWKFFERMIVPRLKYCITVNQSIVDLFEKEYGKKFSIVRNIPNINAAKIAPATRAELQVPEDKFMLILQGSINIDRGAEELLEVAQKLDDTNVIYIIGGGDQISFLHQKANDLQLGEKVVFLGRQPFEKMMQYTQLADLGLILDKDTNINYTLSLPNKLFEYMHAHIPVLASNLVESQRIIQHYNFGWKLEKVTVDSIYSLIIEAKKNVSERMMKKENTKRAAQELTWENEKQVLIAIYHDAIK